MRVPLLICLVLCSCNFSESSRSATLGTAPAEAASSSPPPSTQPVLSRKSDELLVQPAITEWPRKPLRVCFRTPELTGDERTVIRLAAYEWEKATNLRFTGFGNCPVPVADAEFGVLQDEGAYPMGTGGPPYAAISLNIKYTNINTVCASSEANRESCLLRAAIHEFGHTLGFAHEQVRGDESALTTMNTCSQWSLYDLVDGYVGTPVFYGPWDLYSVMNYCNPAGTFVSDRRTLSESDANGAAAFYGQPVVFADVNGDHRDDMVIQKTDSIAARLSTGASFGSEVVFSPASFAGTQATRFADVDGDNRADAIAVNANQVIVRRSTGSNFGAEEVWSTIFAGLVPGVYGRHGVFFADVTGDNRADQIIIDENAVVVRRSLLPSSAAFGPDEVWLSASSFEPDTIFRIHTPQCTTLDCAWRHIPFAYITKIVNVTADNRADLVLFTQTGVRVFPSNGIAFLTSSSSVGPVCPAGNCWRSSQFFGNRTTSVADFDGDGLKDLIAVNETALVGPSQTTVARSNDAGFPATQVVNGAFFGARGTYFANVDGVAGDEMIAINENRIFVSQKSGNSYGTATQWGSVPGSWQGPRTVWWANPVTGGTQIWYMNGAKRTGFADLAEVVPQTTNWRAVLSADFDHDGQDDLIWQNSVSGALQIWFTDGTSRTSFVDIPEFVPASSGWKLKAAADFNLDGQVDLLWHHGASGALQVWYMSGNVRMMGGDLNEWVTDSSGWRLVGSGDFNLDGKPDLLWHNGTSGQLQAWFMNGIVRTDFQLLSETVTDSSGWRYEGANDLNGDGKVDLLWHSSTGAIQAWLMNGTTRTSFVNLVESATLDWRVIAR